MSGVGVPSRQRCAWDYRNIGTGGAGETWYVAGQATGPALLAGSALAPDLLVAVPFVASMHGNALDRLGFEVTSGGVDTGRLGIYDTAALTTLYPGALVVDSGAITITGAVFLSATVSAVLTPGRLYWAALVLDTNNTIRVCNVGGQGNILGISNSGGVTALRHGVTVAYAYAALPATFPGGATYLTASPPAIFMRYSA